MIWLKAVHMILYKNEPKHTPHAPRAPHLTTVAGSSVLTMEVDRENFLGSMDMGVTDPPLNRSIRGSRSTSPPATALVVSAQYFCRQGMEEG